MAFTQLLDKALRSEPYLWSDCINYTKYNVVLANNGTPYIALKSTGPDMPNPAIDPMEDTNREYWGVHSGFGIIMRQCDYIPDTEIFANTVVTLPVIDGHQLSYVPGTYSLMVYADGCLLVKDTDYSEEIGSTAKTFTLLKRYPKGVHIHCVIYGDTDIPEEVVVYKPQAMALMSDGSEVAIEAELSDGTNVITVYAQKTYI